jgi:hypothetical protein
MNLAGLFELALLGENVGVDLWSFRSVDGRSIHKALAYLVPFVAGQQKWPYQQIVEFKMQEMSPLLVVAAQKYNDPRDQDLVVKMDTEILRRIDVFPFRWRVRQ